MPKRNLLIIITLLFAATYSHSSAQQVSTLYFLENAPMRHTINPAFQPVSEFYLPLPFAGFFNLTAGNSQFTLQDICSKDPKTGENISVLHPNAQTQFWNSLPSLLRGKNELQFNLLSWGWSFREHGYFHVNSSERIELIGSMPNQLFGQLFNPDMNQLDLSNLAFTGNIFSELALGYSHRFNDKWTVGGKIKVLFGHAHMQANFDNLNLTIANQNAKLVGSGHVTAAGAINSPLLYGNVTKQEYWSDVWEHLIPSGYGGAIDLGFTYNPIKHIQLSASITDLGFMRWHEAEALSVTANKTFNELNGYDYNDYLVDGTLDIDSIASAVCKNMQMFTDAMDLGKAEQKPYQHRLTAKLNIGLDANFWKNRIGLGIYSQTRFYDAHTTEEITLGAAFKPFNWFNIAASYSFINGHWSNLGAAFSVAPYDGIMLTFAADYLPFKYHEVAVENITLPINDNANVVNVSIGVAIVTGTNTRKWKYKDNDGDGVYNLLDICPKTPLNVIVDTEGCPIDFDRDGVPDYMDECPDTPTDLLAFVNERGCPETTEVVIDSTNMTSVALNKSTVEHTTDSISPELIDSDNDGVVDTEDACPNTYGTKENKGCPPIKREIRNILEKSLAGIQFEFDKATILPYSYELLNQIAQIFICHPNYSVEIQGHTDISGQYEYNMILSQRRADAVRKYLIEKGVLPDMLTAKGYGPDYPIADNDTRLGRKQNRRVEFKVTYEEITYEIINDQVEDK